MTSQREGQPRATTIAVTSGKGGVGKTNVVVNLAVALARLGHRAGILDADFGLGNVDVLLGLVPEGHVGHLLTGERTIDEVVVQGPLGVRIVPASSGLQRLTALTPVQMRRLHEVIHRFAGELDFLIIDTASGVSSNVIETLQVAGRVAVVTSLEPAAIVDAYATAKIFSAHAPGTEIGVVVNAVRDAGEAALAFRQLDTAAERFLRRRLRYYGFVTRDAAVREAVGLQRAVVDHLPQAAASRCFRILASRIAGMGPAVGGLRLAAGAQPESAEVPLCA